MDINFFKNKENTLNSKLTVQRTGKLGISKGAEELMGLKPGCFAKIGTKEDEELILMIVEEDDSYSFKISKAGEYYYINARNLLNDMGIDYRSKDTIIFDLFKTETKNVYKMEKRVIKK